MERPTTIATRKCCYPSFGMDNIFHKNLICVSILHTIIIISLGLGLSIDLILAFYKITTDQASYRHTVAQKFACGSIYRRVRVVHFFMDSAIGRSAIYR